MYGYQKRSTAAPMDWQASDGSSRSNNPFSRGPSGRSIFEDTSDEARSRKRPHYDSSMPSSPFSSPSPPPPIFGAAQTSAYCSPFIFQTPATLNPAPPFNPDAFDPIKAFPEVEMADSSFVEHQSAAAQASTLDTEAATSQVTMPVGRKMATGAIKRERKKREKEKGHTRGNRRAMVEDASESDEGSEDPSDHEDKSRPSRRSKRGILSRWKEQPTGPSSHHYTLQLPDTTAKGVSHSEIPFILLGYLQFFFNLCIVLLILFLLVQFILTVRADIRRRVDEVSVEIMQEIATCTNLYLANRCEPEKRVPAMQQPCTTWEHCMNRDPTVIGRANVGAETFAGVVNSFVEEISWKTMGFTITILAFLPILLNAVLSFYRHTNRPELAHQSTPPVIPPPNPFGHLYPQHGYGGPWGAEMSGGHAQWQRIEQNGLAGTNENNTGGQKLLSDKQK